MDYLPFAMLIVWAFIQQQDIQLGLTTEAQWTVLVVIVTYLITSLQQYLANEKVFKKEMERIIKLDAELHPLPKQFSLRLITSVVATPDEIAEALTSEEQRKHWDIHISSCKQENGYLDIQYKNSGTFYQISHVLLNNQGKYIVRENKVRNGGQSQYNFFYLIEEVENRPYHARIMLFGAKQSESDARHQIKNLNSLRNFLQQKNRPEAIVASLKLLKKPQTESEMYLQRLTNRGLVIQEEFDEVGSFDIDEMQSHAPTELAGTIVQ
jgi:hypothetical protein